MPTPPKKREPSQLAFRPVLEARQSPDLKSLLGGVIQELKAVRSLLQEPGVKELDNQRFRPSE